MGVQNVKIRMLLGMKKLEEEAGDQRVSTYF